MSSNAKSPPYLIRHSLKAKRLRLLVKPGMIELVLPPKITERQALAFLYKHKTWAEAKLRELNEKQAISSPGSFSQNVTLPWQGEELPLKIVELGTKISRVRIDHLGIQIGLPYGLVEDRDGVALRAFYHWTQKWLHAKVVQIVEHHAPRYGLIPREIRIKNMKTRWGSCGPRNDININWLLALAPEPVLEYVVVHEICHIKERNHSSAFWALVASHLPEYLSARWWVRTKGVELIRRISLTN